MRGDRTRLGQHLATFDFFTLGAAQQHADVVAGLTLVEQLAEHFDAGAGGLDGRADADDFDFFADLDDAALDTTGHDGATTGDREDVFDRASGRACRWRARGSGYRLSSASARRKMAVRRCHLCRLRGPSGAEP